MQVETVPTPLEHAVKGRNRSNEACEMCGLPSSAARSGVRIRLRVAAENASRRDRKRTVWCCSKSCANQAFAVSMMGPATHKWPVTLAEFTTAHCEEIERAIQAGSHRTETPFQAVDSTGPKNGDFAVLGLPRMEPISVRSQAYSARKGRPRKWASEAERLRAYRATRRASADVMSKSRI